MLKCLMLLAIGCCCNGCILSPLTNNYVVELEVEKEQVATSFTITYPNFRGEVGDTSINKKAIYVSVEASVPIEVKCMWASSDGSINSVIIPVHSLLPSGFCPSRDTLIFSLTPSNSVNLSVGILNNKYSERRILVGTFPSPK